MACVKRNSPKQKPATFSLAEIEAARQLIQLSSAGGSVFDEDPPHSSNNSYSVQWKPQADDDVYVSVSVSQSSTDDAIEDVLAEIEEDERLRRRNKRYRSIQDLYNVTDPLYSHVPPVAIKLKRPR